MQNLTLSGAKMFANKLIPFAKHIIYMYRYD